MNLFATPTISRDTCELVGTIDCIVWADEDGIATIAKLKTAAGTIETVKGECEGEGHLQPGLSFRFMGRWVNHFKYGKQFQFSTFILDAPHNEAGIVAYLIREACWIGKATAKKLWNAYGADAVVVLRTDPARVAGDGLMIREKAQQASDELKKGEALEKTKVDLFSLFAGRGFTKTTIRQCIEKWGATSAERIRRDPYAMMVEDVSGAGFKRCDRLYIDLGLNPNRIKRQMFAAWYDISSDSTGHTWHPEGVVKRAVVRTVGLAEAKADKALELGQRGGWLAVRKDQNGKKWIAEAKKAENERDLAADTRCHLGKEAFRIIGGYVYFLESKSTKHIKIGFTTRTAGERRFEIQQAIQEEGTEILATISAENPAALEKQLHQRFADARLYGEWFTPIPEILNLISAERQKVTPITHRATFSVSAPCLWPTEIPAGILSAHQSLQIQPILKSRLAILAGSPGTGKTYVAAAIIRQVIQRYGEYAVAVCAPTGKAAVRITEAMKRYNLPITATTIHRLLGVSRNGRDRKGWAFKCDRDHPLPQQFVFVDEWSMGDTDIAASLFQAFAPGTHVLLIGDPGQLPPVGHGAPLRDMIDASVPCATLTEIQRNAGMIVRACAAIKDGEQFETCKKYEAEQGRNLLLAECETPEEQIATLTTLLNAMRRNRNNDPVWDVQILCAMNEKSKVSRVPLNAILQNLLNPAIKDELAPEEQNKQNKLFRRNDKIICLRNCFMTLHGLATAGHTAAVSSYKPLLNENDGLPSQAFLANGDTGRVLAVDPGTVIADFTMGDDKRVVKIPMSKTKDEGTGDSGGGDGSDNSNPTKAKEGSAGDFALAYAITVHKSQGSEWPVVLVIVDDAAGAVASREHFYTAISRASKFCIVLGKQVTIAKQIRRQSLKVRKTFLKELVNGVLT